MSVRPRLLATDVAAAAALTPVALTTACTRVVRGLMVVEPEGAFRVMVLTTPVSIFTPPVAMMVPVMPEGIRKFPFESVVVW